MLLVLVGATGAGKTTVAEALAARLPRLRRLKSTTTRAPRGPEDSLWYDFVGLHEFTQMIDGNAFVEHTVYGDNAYGLSVHELIRSLVQPSVVALDHNGVKSVLAWFQELGLDDHVVTVHVHASEATRRQRLVESRVNGAEVFEARAQQDAELQAYGATCQHQVVNETAKQLKAAVSACKRLVERRHQVHAIDKATSADTEDWYTPAYVFEALGCWFHLDVASPEKPLPWIPATEFMTKEDGEPSLDKWLWSGPFGENGYQTQPFIWMNPPYGRGIGKWVDLFLANGNGVGLVFARAGTKWFEKLQREADAILWLPGRIAFCGPDGKPKADSAPAGSILFASGTTGVEALERAHTKLGGVLTHRTAPTGDILPLSALLDQGHQKENAA